MKVEIAPVVGCVTRNAVAGTTTKRTSHRAPTLGRYLFQYDLSLKRDGLNAVTIGAMIRSVQFVSSIEVGACS
jgi:hypothetical protein